MRFASRRAVAVLLASAAVSGAGCKMAADSQNVQGVRLFQQGQYQPALQEFQKALSSDPKNADAYYNMAATTHRMGLQSSDQKLLAQAETLYNQCLDLDPKHTDCYRGLAVLLAETGRQDRAFNLLKNWASTDPKSADARIELARLYEEHGDLETAKVHLNQALLADQNNARAWAALGSLRERVGDYSQALANYQRAWSLNSAQAGVAERIAVLNQSLMAAAATPAGTPAPDATRTVTSPAPPMR